MFESAEAALTGSKTTTARHLVDAAVGGIASDPPTSPRAARNALEDAKDELDVRRAVRGQLRAQLAAPDTSDIYKTRLDAAIDAVLKAEAAARVQAVLDAANKARVELVRGILAVQYLDRRNLFERNAVSGLSNLSQWPLGDYDRERDAATAPWRAAVAALANDADAKLDL